MHSVYPSGNPISLSHSFGVSLRTSAFIVSFVPFVSVCSCVLRLLSFSKSPSAAPDPSRTRAGVLSPTLPSLRIRLPHTSATALPSRRTASPILTPRLIRHIVGSTPLVLFVIVCAVSTPTPRLRASADCPPLNPIERVFPQSKTAIFTSASFSSDPLAAERQENDTSSIPAWFHASAHIVRLRLIQDALHVFRAVDAHLVLAPFEADFAEADLAVLRQPPQHAPRDAELRIDLRRREKPSLFPSHLVCLFVRPGAHGRETYPSSGNLFVLHENPPFRRHALAAGLLAAESAAIARSHIAATRETAFSTSALRSASSSRSTRADFHSR